MTPLSMKLAEHVADCLKLISSGTDDVVEEAGGKKKKKSHTKVICKKEINASHFVGAVLATLQVCK